MANGNVTTYSYNLANWLTGMSNKDGSEVISSFTYGYYASGNQRTETDHEGVTTTYTYDGLGRLTQEASSEGKVYNYTYDANSNRASMVVTNNNVTIESVNYSYDANNRLLNEATTLLAGSETTTYTYDDNGNLLSNFVYSSTNTVISSLVYTYDGFNQQASVSANGGTVTAHYAYNAQGIRTSKTLGLTTTEFLLDGGAVVGEQTGNSVNTYLRGSNLISANDDTYYLFNGHGDVVNLSNENGSSTKTYEYDAFGVEQNIDELDHNPFRYCSEYFDQETGTYYLRARYYDPKRGRFTQEDTLGLGTYSQIPSALMAMQIGNLYVYCVNNPVRYCDPSGHKVDLSPHVKQTMMDPVGGTGHTEGVAAEMAAEAKAIAEAAALEKAAEEAEAAAAAATEAAAGEMAETIDMAIEFVNNFIDFELSSTFERSIKSGFWPFMRETGAQSIYVSDNSEAALTIGFNRRDDSIWLSNFYVDWDLIFVDLVIHAGLDSTGIDIARSSSDGIDKCGYYVDLTTLSIGAEASHTTCIDDLNSACVFDRTSVSLFSLALLLYTGSAPMPTPLPAPAPAPIPVPGLN